MLESLELDGLDWSKKLFMKNMSASFTIKWI